MTKDFLAECTACLTGRKLAQREVEAENRSGTFEAAVFLSSVLNKKVLLLLASSCILARGPESQKGFVP